MLQKTNYFLFEKISSCNGVRSAVFTRSGGYSTGHFSSLNLGIHVNDNNDDVVKNRMKALKELNFSLDRLIGMEQVHSDNIKEVTFQDRGKGSSMYEDAIPSTDAVFCKDKGTVLMAVVADCAVTVFYDPYRHVMAIGHCGWRGTVKKIPEKLIYSLKKNYNSNPCDLIAGISPSLGPCCFEVKEDVISEFHNNFGDVSHRFFEERDNKTYLNLTEAITYQLLTGGIKKDNIETIKLCTSCRNDLFFSYRKEKGLTGRCGVFIGMD